MYILLPNSDRACSYGELTAHLDGEVLDKEALDGAGEGDGQLSQITLHWSDDLGQWQAVPENKLYLVPHQEMHS